MLEPADWLLTVPERANARTRIDERHPGVQAWAEHNRVRPLIHGATYFRELYEAIEATRSGDLVLFTDWQGDADQRLAEDPASAIVEVFARAHERGVTVRELLERFPGRVAVYGLENQAGAPVYVHAKVCVIDDTWASVGSDNFSRRSWTHDSELAAVVLDEAYARDLRLTLAAEHLDRLDAVEEHGLAQAMAHCVDPVAMFEAYAAHAAAVDAWHRAGRTGKRPPGRLRRLEVPRVGTAQRAWAAALLDIIHDPDGTRSQLTWRSRPSQ